MDIIEKARELYGAAMAYNMDLIMRFSLDDDAWKWFEREYVLRLKESRPHWIPEKIWQWIHSKHYETR